MNDHSSCVTALLANETTTLPSIGSVLIAQVVRNPAAVPTRGRTKKGTMIQSSVGFSMTSANKRRQ